MNTLILKKHPMSFHSLDRHSFFKWPDTTDQGEVCLKLNEEEFGRLTDWGYEILNVREGSRLKGVVQLRIEGKVNFREI